MTLNSKALANSIILLITTVFEHQMNAHNKKTIGKVFSLFVSENPSALAIILASFCALSIDKIGHV